LPERQAINVVWFKRDLRFTDQEPLCAAHDQKEIEYIEESDGILNCFEFKLGSQSKTKIPKAFAEAYPGSTFKTITAGNFFEFMLQDVLADLCSAIHRKTSNSVIAFTEKHKFR
jgi:hypothetical protein